MSHRGAARIPGSSHAGKERGGSVVVCSPSTHRYRFAPLVSFALCLAIAVLCATPSLRVLATGPGLSETPRDSLWITDGPVFAIVPAGDLLYVGGNFGLVGPYTGLGAPLSLAAGALAPRFPRVEGDVDAGVLAVVSDGNGGWFIGGTFTEADGVARDGLAHILADGELESHADLEKRLLKHLHIPPGDLFRTPKECLDEAYEIQGARIAYQDANMAQPEEKYR